MRASNFKISTRIGAGFLILVAFTLLLGALSLVQLSNVAGTTERIATRNLPSVQLMGDLRELLNEIRRTEARHLLSSSRKEMKELEAGMAAARKKLTELDAVAAGLFNAGAERDALAAYQRHRAAWYAANEQMAPASRAGKQDEATTIYNGDSYAAFSAAMAEIIKLSASSSKEAAAAWDGAKAVHRDARAWVLVGSAVAVGLALAMALLIARSIARPIQEAVRSAGEIAEGDMTVALSARGSDETAQLLHSLETMRTKLASVVYAVRQSSDLFATASAEIAQGNHELSERTEQQASALQQTAGSMEQLGTTVRLNSDSAQQGNRLALTASSVAVRGRDAVRQVVETMNEINHSSQKIAEITSVIDGIAFQTNILALNAAVEAARAGEQGRGFAVVASEVRSLAGRSAQAAKDIKALIGTSVEKVRNGTERVDEAGTTMTEVVDAIQRVADLMGEISVASREQLTGVSQVGEAVTHIDQVTQQNAALVEQLAAAAGSLKSQAEQLVGTVAVFKLDEHAELGAVAFDAGTSRTAST